MIGFIEGIVAVGISLKGIFLEDHFIVILMLPRATLTDSIPLIEIPRIHLSNDWILRH